VIVHVGMEGFIGYLLPIVIALLGLLLIFNPAQRVFYSLLAAVVTLATWITSNLGGFILGLLLGLVGTALAFAWSPPKARPTVSDDQADENQADENQADENQREAEPEAEDQAAAETPGVQPEMSHSRPRHRRPSPGVLSGE
jgi:hypothetical protein